MYSFLVLGIIPGTNIQITFQGWITILGLLACGVGIYWLASHHKTLVASFTQRTVLYANQLHVRIYLLASIRGNDRLTIKL